MRIFTRVAAALFGLGLCHAEAASPCVDVYYGHVLPAGRSMELYPDWNDGGFDATFVELDESPPQDHRLVGNRIAYDRGIGYSFLNDELEASVQVWCNDTVAAVTIAPISNGQIELPFTLTLFADPEMGRMGLPVDNVRVPDERKIREGLMSKLIGSDNDPNVAAMLSYATNHQQLVALFTEVLRQEQAQATPSPSREPTRQDLEIRPGIPNYMGWADGGLVDCVKTRDPSACAAAEQQTSRMQRLAPGMQAETFSRQQELSDRQFQQRRDSLEQLLRLQSELERIPPPR